MNPTAATPSPSMSPIEHIFIALAVLVGSLSLVVWGGANLSSLVSGQGVPGVGLGDSLRAIPGLVAQPAVPADAWPVGSRSLIAGSVVYWLSTGLVLVAVAVAVLAARRVWRGLTPGRRRLGVDAHARFATRRELRPLLIDKPVPGRFVFGLWNGRMIATENRRWAPNRRSGISKLWARVTGELRSGQQGDITSLAICGPTRCGKTSQCAEPGLLDWAGPAIVLSVKRDLMDTTIARRRDLGDVRVFDPGGFLASGGSHIVIGDDEIGRWSPLRMAHTAVGAKKAGEALSAWTPQAGVEGGMGFWSTQGKLLFSGLLAASALSDRPSMNEVAKWVFDMEMPDPSNEGKRCPPRDILIRAFNDARTADVAEDATRHLAAIWNKPDPKIVASVYATAQTVCDPWLDPSVVAATDLDGEGEWIDLDWLMDTGVEGDRANTLYLLVSLDDYERLSPVLAGLLSA